MSKAKLYWNKNIKPVTQHAIILDLDSSVGIATLYGFDGMGIESRWERDFSASVQTGAGAHPTPCAMGTGYLSKEVK